MRHVPPGAPPDERGGRWRGVMDLMAGHYPQFLFGLPVGRLLPVFHFHETTVAALEPAFQYLADNGYRTVVSADVARLVHEGHHPGPRTVMLAFDDALASLWLVVGPLLAKYDLQAVTYAIPGRITDATSVRPTVDDGPVDVVAADTAPNPFVTWPELRALSSRGRVDVQSHTWSHSMIFTGAEPVGVVEPATARDTPFVWPRLNAGASLEFLPPSRLGFPLFARRSRMSDGRRYWPDEAACTELEHTVAAHGGAAFFERPDWRGQTSAMLARINGRFESDADREREIEFELVAARDELERRLGSRVAHVCLPWGVTGACTTGMLKRLGVITAFANRRAGKLAVSAGDAPFHLKRLASRHIFALPGRGRKIFTTFR